MTYIQVVLTVFVASTVLVDSAISDSQRREVAASLKTNISSDIVPSKAAGDGSQNNPVLQKDDSVSPVTVSSSSPLQVEPKNRASTIESFERITSNLPSPTNDTSSITSAPTAATTTSQPNTTTSSTTASPITPPTTHEPNTTTSSTTASPSTPPTTLKPSTTTSSTTASPITPPTTLKPITSSTTVSPSPNTTTPAPTTTQAPPPPEHHFHGPSFIGGIVLSFGMMFIGLVAWKFYKARQDRNYRTLSNFGDSSVI